MILVLSYLKSKIHLKLSSQKLSDNFLNFGFSNNNFEIMLSCYKCSFSLIKIYFCIIIPFIL
jgi:hypothetical protein